VFVVTDAAALSAQSKRMSPKQAQASSRDLVRCVSFNPRKRVLCAGTQQGRVCMWRMVIQSSSSATAAPADSDGAQRGTEADWEVNFTRDCVLSHNQLCCM